MSETIKIRKTGSGRVKGSVSFMSVRAGDLISKISGFDPNLEIKVSRLQMEALGLEPKLNKITVTTLITPSTTIKPSVNVQVTDFDAQ
jgi:hypothetical protein